MGSQQAPTNSAAQLLSQSQDSISTATKKGSLGQLRSQSQASVRPKEPLCCIIILPQTSTISHFPSDQRSDNTMRLIIIILLLFPAASQGTTATPIPTSSITASLPLLLNLMLGPYNASAKPFLQQPQSSYQHPQPLYPHHRTRGDIPPMPSHSVYFRKLGRVSQSLGYVTPVSEIDVADAMQATEEGILQGTRIAMMLRQKKEVSRAQAASSGSLSKDAKEADKAIIQITGDYNRYYVADSKWAEQTKGGLVRLAKARDYLESASTALGIIFDSKQKAKRDAWHLMNNNNLPLGERITRSLTALLLGGAALVSTVVGLYTQAQLIDIKNRAASNREDLVFQIRQVEQARKTDSEMTWKALETLASYTHLSLYTLKAEAIMKGIATNADVTTDILTAIQHNRLSPKAITTEQAQEIFIEVTKQAHKFGFVPLTQEAYHLFQCAVSYTATKPGVLTLYITSATAIIALLLAVLIILAATYILWALRRHRCNIRYRQQRLKGQKDNKEAEKDPKLAEWEKQLAQASIRADGKELAQLILHPPKKYRPRNTAPPGIIQWLWPPVEEEAHAEGLYPLI